MTVLQELYFLFTGKYTTVKIAGVQQSTMIDYPGKIACVVFTQ